MMSELIIRGWRGISSFGYKILSKVAKEAR